MRCWTGSVSPIAVAFDSIAMHVSLVAVSAFNLALRSTYCPVASLVLLLLDTTEPMLGRPDISWPNFALRHPQRHRPGGVGPALRALLAAAGPPSEVASDCSLLRAAGTCPWRTCRLASPVWMIRG